MIQLSGNFTSGIPFTQKVGLKEFDWLVNNPKPEMFWACNAGKEMYLVLKKERNGSYPVYAYKNMPSPNPNIIKVTRLYWLMDAILADSIRI